MHGLATMQLNNLTKIGYRGLQVGRGTVAELKVTQANIIDHNTIITVV